MIIVGGEGQLDESEIRITQQQHASAQSKKEAKKAKKGKKNGDSELCVEIEPDEDQQSDSVSMQLLTSLQNELGAYKKSKNGESIENEEGEEEKVDDFKRTLNDVWIYDTLLHKWHEIAPPLRI